MKKLKIYENFVDKKINFIKAQLSMKLKYQICLKVKVEVFPVNDIYQFILL